MADWLSEDRFVIDQLIRPMVNLYRISAGPTPVAFVRQKRMAIKEDIRFFADETETHELWRIKARSMMELGGRYDVTTPDGVRIGVLEKVFGKSLLRSTWRVLDADEREVALVQERSLPAAIIRRAIDFVPDVGGLIPIPYNFDLLSGGQVIGRMDRKFQLRDRYVLDLAGDPDKKLDRRLAIALAIGLDTLQNR